MADQPINSTNLDTMKALLTLLSSVSVVVGRNLNSPLKYVMNVSDEVAQVGKAINIMVGTPLTPQSLGDGDSLILNNTVGTGQTLTLDKQAVIPFAVTQYADTLANSAELPVLVQQAIASLLNGVETDFFSQVTSLGNNAGTYNTALTQDAVNAAVATLDANLAPQPRYGFLRHDAKAWPAFAAFGQTVYSYQTGIAPSPINSAAHSGPIYYNGVNWFKTQAINKSTNNISNVVWSPGGLAIAARPYKMVPDGVGVLQENVMVTDAGIPITIMTSFDKNTQSIEIVFKCLYGYKIPQPNFAVELRS